VLFGSLPAQAQVEVQWPALRLVQRWTGLAKPLGIANARDGSGRLFVVEQEGRIRIVKGGQLLAEPLLDIRNQVLCCEERGLLGLAFPPQFAQNQYFYVFYSDRRGTSVLSRFWISDQNPDRAEPNSEQLILTAPQPGVQHKGGQLAFGPDGYLYVSLGDGKWDNPTTINMNAQNPALLLGKILRIDPESVVSRPQQPTGRPAVPENLVRKVFLPAAVARGEPRYLIPQTNPFVGVSGYRGEIWAMGLRNPWRFSFDRQTGDLFIGDVGKSRYEEIDFQAAGSSGGQNYGWPFMEGNHCYSTPTCSTQGLTLPAVEYEHRDPGRCAVMGGYVYRGQAISALRGIYLFGDYCTGEIWGMQRVNAAWEYRLLGDASFLLSSFGEDEAGNMYVTDYANGAVYQIAPATG
jgi:glucose/arabinose dehydrogenase